ncbi:hypothetical protein [Streptomyces sp. NPDC093514]|uniref:hypothetical protein n=1 Tax=Streptomyces sp. NPDC093514 TaxID=3366039 RepID=UPI0037F6A5A2
MRSVIMKTRVPEPVVSAGLFAGVVAAVGASAAGPWWGAPAAACAFLAGRGPGSGRSAALALALVPVAAVPAVLLAPAWLGWAGRFVLMLFAAAMLPWFAGRFLRQYRELVRAGWERAARLEREQRLSPNRPACANGPGSPRTCTTSWVTNSASSPCPPER